MCVCVRVSASVASSLCPPLFVQAIFTVISQKAQAAATIELTVTGLMSVFL